MESPGVPGGRGATLTLPCGERVPVSEFDLGQRVLACACGDRHAVVMDVHPPGRFVPESVVEVLRETVEPADEYDRLATPHLLGMVMEEFPDEVAVADVAEDGDVGFALVWVTTFDDRRLHEIVVELVVELMEHAISHAEDGDAMGAFEEQMLDFDVSAFVSQYRDQRDFESEHDTAR